jgi:hypothetical protein
VLLAEFQFDGTVHELPVVSTKVFGHVGPVDCTNNLEEPESCALPLKDA